MQPARASKALPEFSAVTPTTVVILGRSVLGPSLLTIAVSRADLPGRIANRKYGRGRPAGVSDGVRPNPPGSGAPVPRAAAAAKS